VDVEVLVGRERGRETFSEIENQAEICISVSTVDVQIDVENGGLFREAGQASPV